MDEEERERDDLTADEEEQVEETGTSGEEAHRAGEFEELRGMMQQMLDAIGEVMEAIGEVMEAIGGYSNAVNAMAVDNGAKFADGEDGAEGVGGDVVVLDEPEDPRARDYTI